MPATANEKISAEARRLAGKAREKVDAAESKGRRMSIADAMQQVRVEEGRGPKAIVA